MKTNLKIYLVTIWSLSLLIGLESCFGLTSCDCQGSDTFHRFSMIDDITGENLLTILPASGKYEVDSIKVKALVNGKLEDEFSFQSFQIPGEILINTNLSIDRSSAFFVQLNRFDTDTLIASTTRINRVNPGCCGGGFTTLDALYYNGKALKMENGHWVIRK